MHLRILLLFTLFGCKSLLFSQNVASPSKSDFSGTLSFLASDWMEGRGATQKGGFMASEYIASMMGLYQLAPYNATDYFQNFKIQEHNVSKAILEIKKGKETISLSPKTDFKVTPIAESVQNETQIVFAGYGLSATNEGYDDYKNQNIKNKIVVVLKGFPSHQDTLSVTYKKFKKLFPEESNLDEIKLQTAINKGAVALIIIDNKETYKKDKDDSAFHSLENSEIKTIPIFKISKSAAEKLFLGSKISLENFEKKATQKLQSASILLKNTTVNFSIELKTESYPVRNILGMIPGKDTTKTVIIGAHYDHLGIIKDSIYNGADDNASGTSGMLALAKKWSESNVQPKYNLLFASWTAEEMGLLGSEYFVQNFDFSKQKILFAINMDMISRSAPEDKTARILSIGTEKKDENLRKMASEINVKLQSPFSLDLWETNGHSGSDYASFTSKRIPVMTFFSGFHDDYHTPNDKVSKTDSDKIKDVLFIVNNVLLNFKENQLN